MSDLQSSSFLHKLATIIKNHISDENFGVAELSREVNMSRSNLLRKVKKLSKQSVSQFIREVKLIEAFELLQHSDFTVSEVAFQVGFNSTSYFIKCFHEYFGYTPGEVEKLSESPTTENSFFPHELVAIVFTDIQGYTAIMQENEKKAISLIKKHREIFTRLTKKYKGRIIQYYGDGTLSVHNSVIDAVNCSIEMQGEFQKPPFLPVRIGIHSGDIVFNKNGIVGDGVNIASRIESLGMAGSILVSDKVKDEIKNQPGIQSTSLGVHELKNVSKPIEVYAICNPGLVVPKHTHQDDLKKKNHQSKIFHSLYKYVIDWRWLFALPLILLLGYVIGGNFIKNSLIKASRTENNTVNEKSIAVLPFINDSNDSSNLYIINGLMEAVLNNLQHVNEMRVISRTSVERYRERNKLIPEIARELNVKYIVEGSGQKLGDQLLLNIQLINGQSDTHLWSGQYKKQIEDIFDLQIEIAEDIAREIAVIITPNQKKRINKRPTENLVAYDYFLKATDFMQQGTREGLISALPYFRKAIKEDDKFALAYADLAISYYYLDALQEDKKYLDSINYYADLALLYDDRLPQSMLAKALHYINNHDYTLAEPYLVKAHNAHPGSVPILNILADFYTTYSPNIEKYLEYSLKGIQIDNESYDSTNASFSMLHVSNALIQTGFTDESRKYLDKSLSLDPDNIFAHYLSAYIDFVENRNLRNTNKTLIQVLSRDTGRVDVLQEIGKTFYYLRAYSEAAEYYTKYLNIKKRNNLMVFPGEDLKIAWVYRAIGNSIIADSLMKQFRQYANNDESIYKELSLASLCSVEGNVEEALEHLRIFSNEDIFTYWIILFLPMDPMLEDVFDLPEGKVIMEKIKTKFYNHHNSLKIKLSNAGLI